MNTTVTKTGFVFACALFMLGFLECCVPVRAQGNGAQGSVAISQANATMFGPNVYVFDPRMSADAIQSTVTKIYQKMEADQFGPERYALLFKPGTSHISFNVGFYTQVMGLGHSPDDVDINGGVTVDAKWDPNGNALDNFWRSLENFSITPSANVPFQSTKGLTRIAVSQASPLRRLHIRGNLEMFDWGPKGNVGYASGGFLADSVVDGEVIPGSQQQWLTRNSTWSQWNNAVWNMVFVGCDNPPTGQFPASAYTVVNRTPIIREKPFLTIDSQGHYAVFVPALQTNSQGVDWANGSTPGVSRPIDRFYLAHPQIDTSATLNAALNAGKSILFTPGVYRLDQALRVTHPDTILLGLGFATLVTTQGQPICTMADVSGVTLAGLILDAGPDDSPQLLQVGPPGSHADHAADPTLLADVTVRTGGPAAGRNDVGVEINSQNVIADQLWIWRADHGNGVGWNVNPTRNGLVVNGNNVTIYGLFNEHHEGYQTVWNGNGGRVYLYQSEMPYDVPNQAAWKHGTINGYASYYVSPHVTRHEAWGVGIYCYFRDAPVRTDCAIQAPDAPGVQFQHLTTIWLDGHPGSEIAHIINSFGGRVYAASPPPAMRQTLNEYADGKD